MTWVDDTEDELLSMSNTPPPEVTSVCIVATGGVTLIFIHLNTQMAGKIQAASWGWQGGPFTWNAKDRMGVFTHWRVAVPWPDQR